MAEQAVQEKETQVKVTTEAEGVEVRLREFSASPQGKTSTSELFTREVFEDALDKVSGKGKFATVPTDSESFAARKQEEIDLEERRL